MIRRKGLLALLLPFALLLGGCCHPPMKEISLAKAQLMEAREAGAPLYAPEKYKEAENLLSQAEAESKKECQKSWKTVKLAQQKAIEAKEAAIKAKLQARVEALKAIRRAQKALAEAREAEAPLYAPDLYQAAINLLEEAQKDFQRESYLESKKKSDKAAQLALKAKEAAIKVKEELARELEMEKRKAKPTTHVVEKGECLWIISSYPQIYGNPLMWPLIYWANKAQIHDPDLIHPGQGFTVPRDYTTKERDKAVHFAKHRGPWSLFDGR